MCQAASGDREDVGLEGIIGAVSEKVCRSNTAKTSLLRRGLGQGETD